MSRRLLAITLLLTACGADEGSLGGACYGNGTCDPGLRCVDRVCVEGAADAGAPDGATPPMDAGEPSADATVPDDARVPRDASAPVDGAATDAASDGGAPPAGEGALGGVTVRRVGPRSAVIDPSGTPHVVVAGDALHHFWLEGEAWRSEVVAPHAEVASVVLDEDGALAVAFLDRHLRNAPLVDDVQRLALARRDASGWVTEDIVAELERPLDEDLRAPDLAVAPDGTIHVVYVRGRDPATRMEVATRAPAGGWSFETVPGAAGIQWFLDPEIAIDASGAPMVAWNQAFAVYLSRRGDGGWSTPQLVKDEESRTPTWDFFATPAGEATFVYYQPYSALTPRTRILRESGASFDEVVCAHINDLPAYSAAVLDDGDIAFSLRIYDSPSATARAGVAVADASACALTPVGPPEEHATDSVSFSEADLYERGGLALAARADQRVLVDLETGSGELAVHRSTDGGATWSRALLARPRLVGAPSAVVLAPDGHAIAIGAELVTQTLSVLEEEGASGFAASAGVTDVRFRSFIGLDAAMHAPSGELLVAYSTNSAVWFTRRGTSGWTAPMMVTTALSELRLVVGPEGRPSIVTSASIWAFDGASWLQRSPPVSTSGDIGVRPSLAYDAAGLEVMATVGSLGDVTLARRSSGGTWTTEVIERSGPTHTALALDALDQPHVLFAQEMTDPFELRYAHRDADGWHVETVEALAATGRSRAPRGLDLAIADDGRPVAVFHSYRTGSARLAVRGASGWTAVDVGSGDDGWFPDLALDGDEAVIAWHDRAAGDLRVARVPLP